MQLDSGKEARKEGGKKERTAMPTAGKCFWVGSLSLPLSIAQSRFCSSHVVVYVVGLFLSHIRDSLTLVYWSLDITKSRLFAAEWYCTNLVNSCTRFHTRRFLYVSIHQWTFNQTARTRIEMTGNIVQPIKTFWNLSHNEDTHCHIVYCTETGVAGELKNWVLGYQ